MSTNINHSGHSGSSSGKGGEEQRVKIMTEELSKTLKEGERMVGPSRRPDGTLRKPIRIRAGYVPQDEVAIYKSKGALWRKEMESQEQVPPGYDPDVDAVKAKTKAAKRNERKKEKRQQAALERSKNLEESDQAVLEKEEVINVDLVDTSSSVKALSTQMNELVVSVNPESSEADAPVQDIDKKIRALKKKIRLAEAQVQKTEAQDLKPEQQEKLARLEGWRQELKLLEDKKA